MDQVLNFMGFDGLYFHLMGFPQLTKWIGCLICFNRDFDEKIENFNILWL